MKKLLKILTISLFIISCDSESISKKDSNKNIPIHRFEKGLFEVTDSISLENLKKEHPVFFEIYVKNVLGSYSDDSPALLGYIQAFTTDPTISEVYKESMEKYPNLDTLSIAFGNAFDNYQNEFKGKLTPKLMSFVSGFSFTIIVDDSLLAFGIDMYLGKDCDFYPRLGIPQYKFHNMSPEYIVSDCMKGWLSTEFELDETKNELLDLMIYHGKLNYACEQLLPWESDHIIARYSKEQTEWCKSNEADIWFHFVDKELLYNSEVATVTKYMGEGPFTAGFPEGSPGEIGKWMGWKIVSAFMKNNPDITLAQLMELDISSSELLNRSKYKPEK